MAVLATVLLRLHKIVIIQAVCGLLLLTFLSIVFGSTVFTRTPGSGIIQRRYSGHGRKSWDLSTCGRLGSTTGDGLLQENLLNILLLFRQGFYCRGDRQKRNGGWDCLCGIAVSSAIQISQLLVFAEGCLSLIDIIHNSLGCMLGSFVENRMLRLV